MNGVSQGTTDVQTLYEHLKSELRAFGADVELREDGVQKSFWRQGSRLTRFARVKIFTSKMTVMLADIEINEVGTDVFAVPFEVDSHDGRSRPRFSIMTHAELMRVIPYLCWAYVNAQS